MDEIFKTPKLNIDHNIKHHIAGTLAVKSSEAFQGSPTWLILSCIHHSSKTYRTDLIPRQSHMINKS